MRFAPLWFGLLVGGLLPAQGQFLAPRRICVQWEQGQLMVPPGEGERRFQVLKPGFQLEAPVLLPKDCSGLGSTLAFFQGNEPWVFEHALVTTPEGERVQDRLRRFRNGRWEQAALLEEPGRHRGFELILPLENGAYFGVRRALHIVAGKREAPFYLLEADPEGRLRVSGNVDAGVPPDCFALDGMPRAYQVALLKGHICILDFHPGWIWIFSREHGRCQRLVKVYDLVDEGRLRKNDFSTVLVGAQPTASGDLLLAARAEAAVLHAEQAKWLEAAAEHLPTVDPDAPKEAAAKRTEPDLEHQQVGAEMLDYAFSRYPELTWLRLDPESGTLEPLAAPPSGAPAEIRSMVELLAFHWMPLWDGTVTGKPVDQLVAEAAARAEAEKARARRTARKNRVANSR